VLQILGKKISEGVGPEAVLLRNSGFAQMEVGLRKLKKRRA
jgi:hypothetical protein